MSDKQSVILQTCLLMLGAKLEPFFEHVCDLQLASALSLLTSAPKSSEYLARHDKLWQELIHPFKLLCECERHYYEWAFLQNIPAYDNVALGAQPPAQQKKDKQREEDHVKFVYSQIPLGLRKTMASLQKCMGGLQQPFSGKLPQSASNLQQLAQNANTDGAQLASLFHLLDELIHGYVMLKITMIQIYQNMNAPYTTVTRVKEMNWAEMVRVCEKLRLKCSKAFTHPWLLQLKAKLLLPELFLLEQVCALECDNTMLPRYDWKHTTFLLMRIRAEHSRWTNRLLARDRDGAAAAARTGSAGAPLAATLRKTLSPPTGGGANTKFNPLLLPTPTVSVTFPAMLHWVHMLLHSMLCKSTLLFFPVIQAKSGEIKGQEEIQSKLERLEVNYIGLIDKLLKRVPNAYSFSIVLDCTGLEESVDPLAPLTVHDDLASPDPATTAAAAGETDSSETSSSPSSRPSGGLANFPVIFQWPSSRAVPQMWNLVSLLLAKQELMASVSSAASAPNSRESQQLLQLPKQTNTYCAAIGPSNHPSDLLVWDYENEFLASQQSGLVAPNSVSYFLCKLDMHKSAYCVVTFQTNTTPVGGAASSVEGVPNSGGMSRESTGSDGHSGGSFTQAPALPTSNSNLFAPSAASAAVAAAPASTALPNAAARKRAFDALMIDFAPILQKLRHQHVFTQMQPQLGKRKV